MFKGITDLAKLNHDEARPFHETKEQVDNAVSDVLRGKVNPPQSLSHSDWQSGLKDKQSGLKDETDAQDRTKGRYGEGRIIDVLG
jgi:hypothetical protein